MVAAGVTLFVVMVVALGIGIIAQGAVCKGGGAEVGISTGKLHARGPMGMEGLCTYKYRLYGHGQILRELNEGKIHLTHRPIPEELPR